MFIVVVVLKLCYMVSDDKDALRFHEHGEVTFELAFQQMLISDRIYIFFNVFIRLKSSERLLNVANLPLSHTSQRKLWGSQCSQSVSKCVSEGGLKGGGSRIFRLDTFKI